MDQRLEDALKFSNYMITLNNQKRILNEQYQNDLIYYVNGGKFIVNQNLISFCSALLHNMNQDSVVLVDDNNIPVEIDNLQEFLTNIVSVYFTASNKYLVEYNKLKNNKSVEGIVL